MLQHVGKFQLQGISSVSCCVPGMFLNVCADRVVKRDSSYDTGWTHRVHAQFVAFFCFFAAGLLVQLDDTAVTLIQKYALSPLVPKASSIIL